MRPATSVAVFTDNDFEKVNGVTTALTAVLAHVPDDLRVRVYTASRLGADRPDYLALASWGVGIPFYGEMQMYWPPYRAFVQRLRRDRVEVIHLTTPGPMGLAALAAARHLGLPLVGSFHTDLAAYTTMLSGRPALGTFMQGYMRWLYSHCERVLVPSAATQALLTASGTPSGRVGVWARGVDTERFTPDRRSAELRAQWRASDRRPVLLYVGRVSKEKRVDHLPVLHDALIRLGVDHRLVVVGEGPWRAELSRRCPDALCLGTLGRDRLAEVYASADVFVFPSTTDTAGNVVLEAQASGLPVLVSGAGGPREQMLSDVTGAVCADAIDAWTAPAARLLTDTGRRHLMGAAACGYARSRRWDQALRPLYDTYRRAARRPEAEPAPAVPAGVHPRHVA